MKKGFRFLCAALVAGMLFSTTGSTFAADGKYVVTATSQSVKAGDTFTVYIAVDGGVGINAITGYLDYNAEYIVPTGGIGIDGKDHTFMTADDISAQINLTPTAANTDYQATAENYAGGTPDGKKTAAELGRIKLAGYLYENGSLVECTDSGALFAIDFKCLKDCDAEVEFKPVKTSGFTANAVIGRDVEGGKLTANSSGKYDHIIGDVDGDGLISATDAICIFRKKTSGASYDPYVGDITKEGSDAFKIADVNGDGTVSSADGIIILRYKTDASKGQLVGTPIWTEKDLMQPGKRK